MSTSFLLRSEDIRETVVHRRCSVAAALVGVSESLGPVDGRPDVLRGDLRVAASLSDVVDDVRSDLCNFSTSAVFANSSSWNSYITAHRPPSIATTTLMCLDVIGFLRVYTHTLNFNLVQARCVEYTHRSYCTILKRGHCHPCMQMHYMLDVMCRNAYWIDKKSKLLELTLQKGISSHECHRCWKGGNTLWSHMAYEFL